MKQLFVTARATLPNFPQRAAHEQLVKEEPEVVQTVHKAHGVGARREWDYIESCALRTCATA